MAPVTLAKDQPRRRLTLRDMVTIAQRQVAAPILCCLCQKPLGNGPVVDEHLVARGLGGGEEVENRGWAHKNCADIKTAGAPTKAHGRGTDATEIARTKRLRDACEVHKAVAAKRLAPTPRPDRPKRKMQSRGFQKRAPGQKQRT